jgi:hypothetical protein
MIYVSLGKNHIREQVEKLNAICLIPPPTREIRACQPHPVRIEEVFATNLSGQWGPPMCMGVRSTICCI